ncbi:hypothetical protein [Helicovermis profundi]|uniref:Uncharacterized protein n=1 Tax=Helicovermis profundi TaxID=3065157 RepID=A0AAU9E5Z2_9FIRM|nr:hypothetical protein HLPR_11140 [Clostridia bacterium S502]
MKIIKKFLLIKYFLFSFIILRLKVLYSFIFRNRLPEAFFIFDPTLQFNLFTVNTILIGFLFSSLGIMLSVSDKPIIRVYEHEGYLDKLYSSIKHGIISHFLSIICIIFTVILSKRIFIYLFFVEILSFSYALFKFLISIFNIFELIKEIRLNNDISDLKHSEQEDDEYE